MAILLIGTSTSFGQLKELVKPPDFSLISSEGDTVTLFEQQGKIVILHFWKSNWGTCHAEIPHLNKVYESYPDSLVQIFGINISDTPGKVLKEIKDYKIAYPILIGRGSSAARDYKIPSIPYLYIINQEGTVDFGEMFLVYKNIKEIIDDLSDTAEPDESKDF